MSRTATATPPPPLFHQKNTTPSIRHASKGNQRSDSQSGFQRHFKSKPTKSAVKQASPLKETTVVPMSASDMLGMIGSKAAAPDPMATANASSISWPEDDNDAASIATSVPSMSGQSTTSDVVPIIATPETTPSSSIYQDNSEASGATLSATAGFSSMHSPAAPSSRSWVNGFGKMARGMFARRREGGDSPNLSASSLPALVTSPLQVSPSSPYIAPSPSSIAPSSTLISPVALTMTPAPEVMDMLDNPLPPHALPPAMAHPHNMPPALTPDSPNIDNPAEALRRYEWTEAQRRQVTEFARLCSQWPQSSYNQSKFPLGMLPPGQYVPQSWANPRNVVRTMQRQSDLERHLCETGGTFHPCSNHSSRSSSTMSSTDVDSLSSGPTAFSQISRQSSLATTVSLGQEQDPNSLCDAVWAASKKCHGPEATEPKTAAALQHAMSSPMVEAWRGEASVVSVSSVTSVTSMATFADDSKTSSAWASLAGSTKSLSELDKMAELATTDKMDIDEPEPLSSIPSIPGSHPRELNTDFVPPTRTLSCPAKRPLTFIADDDDKRRRVVESMAVDDMQATFTDEPAAFAPPAMSASAPTLPLPHPAIIGGLPVKTSDTHPLVISAFMPVDILPTLGKHLIAPTHGREQPIMLGSEIDVPTLLLSCAAAHQCPSEAGPVGPMGSHIPGPKRLIPNSNRPAGVRRPTNLGNLLLSSCPGKRLRMDGPVKGRGPVCRDLATDMRRIKNGGTDAIVCCLDDEELALLGVPWEQYRDIAGEVGLDVIRLPMPDGFTPVSLQLFDAQVSMIVTKYTLRGANVLVHCRGGIGRAGLTACAWAIKMGFVQPHPSLDKPKQQQPQPQPQHKHKHKSRSAMTPAVPVQEEERAIVMSIVERSIAMIRSRRGLKAIETMEQVQFLATYVTWLRESM